MAKKYKHIEDYYSDYPNNGAVFFTLPNGTKSPLFSSKEKATAWYNNWIKNNPDTHISVGGTSTTTKRTKGSGTKTTVAKPAETQEQRDARFLKKYGKTEAEAKEAQQQLILAGYLPKGADDGHWGDKSKAAWDAYVDDEAAYWDGVAANPEGTGVTFTEEQQLLAALNQLNYANNYYGSIKDYTKPENGFSIWGSSKRKPLIDLSGTWLGDALNTTGKFFNDEIFLNKGNARVSAMNTGGYLEYFKPGFDLIGEVMTWFTPLGWVKAPKFVTKVAAPIGKYASKVMKPITTYIDDAGRWMSSHTPEAVKAAGNKAGQVLDAGDSFFNRYFLTSLLMGSGALSALADEINVQTGESIENDQDYSPLRTVADFWLAALLLRRGRIAKGKIKFTKLKNSDGSETLQKKVLRKPGTFWAPWWKKSSTTGTNVKNMLNNAATGAGLIELGVLRPMEGLNWLYGEFDGQIGTGNGVELEEVDKMFDTTKVSIPIIQTNNTTTIEGVGETETSLDATGSIQNTTNGELKKQKTLNGKGGSLGNSNNYSKVDSSATIY